MSEKSESQQPAETTTESTGVAWGDPISPERLEELKEMFERQKIWTAQPSRDIEQSIFWHVELTGADVFWLASLALAESSGDINKASTNLRNGGIGQTSSNLSLLCLDGASLYKAQLARANLSGVQLKRSNLFGAQLKNAKLIGTQLERATLFGAQLERADLSGAQLEGVDLYGAQLKRSNLFGAQLTRADFSRATLERANLYRAQLEGANLFGAQMEYVNLSRTHLEGVDLSQAQLRHADLRKASFDKNSKLNDATLGEVSLDQAVFDNTNLTVVSWEKVRRLGDEREARKSKGARKKSEAFHAAARAYRSLSVGLRNQGLGTDATRFHYRAELMERKSSWWHIFASLRSRQFYTAPAYFGRWLLSWLLGTFAGYGDYFGRLLLTYLVVVSAFAGAMFLAAGRVASFDAIRDVFVLSVTSFHGRGVQPPGLTMTDTLATLTAVEAFFGLLIEGIFIAAFTRRVTGN